MPSHTEIGELIWRIADHLRGDYEKNDNEDVILPFTLLRRLDCVLEKSREKVRETEARVADKVKEDVLKKLLVDAAGVPFYNRSKFSFTELLKDPANIKDNFGAWLEGFSDNIKEILYNFSGGEEKGLAPIYETLARKNLLYLITKEFACEDLDLHPDAVSNYEMGLIYEHLIRKFKEGAAAGEQYTPRDVVQLLVQLVFADVEDTLKKSKGTLVAIYDPAVGTGGMVTVAKEYLTTQWGLEPSNVFIYGQELREKTYAICKADALMKGDDGSRIKQGNTLSDDKLGGHQFNFMLVNPEFGTDWKKIEDTIKKEAERGFDGRFGAGLPEVGDASFLFLQHMISKMTPVEKGGSVIGIVFNGSPLFNGDAGSGWSDIRKWIITNDWLDAIVALPEDMFYNTNIATYLWIVRNNKPTERRGTITLVNGNQERFRTLMRRNVGNKRVELTPTTIGELVQAYRNGKPVEKLAQLFDLEDFGYTRVTVERPLRLKSKFTKDGIESLRYLHSAADHMRAIYEEHGAKVYGTDGKFWDELALNLHALPEVERPNNRDLGNICRPSKWKERLLFVQAAEKLAPYFQEQEFSNYNLFEEQVQAVATEHGIIAAEKGRSLSKAHRTLICRAMSWRDEEADPVIDETLEDGALVYEPDPELRDEERIPLKTDIDAYFAKEVLPYAPDAWMDRTKDKIGYEISFNSYFYEYQSPRDLKAILADLEALDTDADKLQAELRA
jgi:type I restriction enzyme M protein